MLHQSAKPVLYCGDDTERELPVRWCICSHCKGSGKSSAYLGAFTRDDLDDEGPEFCEDYFTGRYDRACDDCGGSGKVQTVDEKQMSKEDITAWRAQCADERADRETSRMERLMEGGWREEGWFGR